MLETLLLLAAYLVLGLACMAVAGWAVITGQFLDIDGLFLALVSASIGGVFLLGFALAVWRGDFTEAL